MRWLACSLLLVCAVVQGCARAPLGRVVADRWIAPDASPLPLASAEVAGLREVFSWSFATAEDLEPWTLVNLGEETELIERGFYFNAPGSDPNLVRNVDFEAEGVDLMELRHSGLAGFGFVQLFWAGEGEEFSEERSVRVAMPAPDGSLVKTFTFRLFEHPEWQGNVRRIRLDPTSAPSRRIQIYSLKGFDRSVDQEKLERIVQAPWAVDFATDVRDSLLLPPGHAQARTVDLGPRSTLEFAVGLDRSQPAEVRFVLDLVDEDGSETEVWSRVLDMGTSGTLRQWLPAVVDLSLWAGQRVRLTFHTEANQPYDILGGMPVVALPQVVSLRRRPAEPARNVILIVVDTLRSDHLPMYGYDRQTAPHLDAWARRRGIVFRNAVASAPWTLPSHASMFTGLDALKHGVNHLQGLPQSLTTLAEQMKARGYSTIAFTGGGYLAPSYGLLQGFERIAYWDKEDQQSPIEVEANMDAALQWLATDATEPYFLLFHTYEVHTPLHPRQPYYSSWASHMPEARTVWTEPGPPDQGEGFRERQIFRIGVPGGEAKPASIDDQQLLSDFYDAGIARADAELGRLFEYLERSGEEQRTVVAATSDHGEALGEKGLTGHTGLYDFNLMVPLILSLPEGTPGSIERQVRLVDLYPTLAEAALLEQPASGLDGRSLLPLVRGQEVASLPDLAISYAASSNYGLSVRRANQTKLIYNNTAWEPVHGAREIFDLIADPQETHPLAEDSEDAHRLVGALEDEYRQHHGAFQATATNDGSYPVTFTLRGDVAHAFRVKAFQLPDNSVTWVRGNTSIHLRPGMRAELFLEGSTKGDLWTVADVDGVEETPFRKVLRLEQLRQEARRIVWIDGGWQDVAAADAVGGQASLEIRWSGMQLDLESVDVDPAVLDRLRALGYVGDS